MSSQARAIGLSLLAGLSTLSSAGAATPHTADRETYVAMNVLDFVIDGPRLAQQGARVDLYGRYLREGALDVVYADATAVARADAWPQPHVVVLTDNASRTLRAKLVACQVDPVSSQLGCDIAIRGRVALCKVTSALGVARQEPCLEAQDETPPAIHVDPSY